MLIAPIPLGAIAPQSVLKVVLKPPLMATPQSSKNGVHWLGLQRPRTSRGLYRVQFFCIVVTNDAASRVIQLRVPDFRTINLPEQQDVLFYMLDLSYDNILTAQYFSAPTPMPPEVLITTINRSIMIGNAAKFRDTVFVPSAPVLVT